MCYIALYSVRKTGNGQTLPTTDVSIHDYITGHCRRGRLYVTMKHLKLSL